MGHPICAVACDPKSYNRWACCETKCPTVEVGTAGVLGGFGSYGQTGDRVGDGGSGGGGLTKNIFERKTFSSFYDWYLDITFSVQKYVLKIYLFFQKIKNRIFNFRTN